MSPQAILRLENLGKAYGGLQAVQGVSLDLEPGQALGVMGPNGSGKTTLFNLVTGFERADEGRVWFQGREITRLPAHKVAGLGLVRTFQTPRPLASLNAWQSLVVPLCSPRARRRRQNKDLFSGPLGEVFRQVGLDSSPGLLNRPSGALSLMQLKKLELARCLALKPKVIFCDELFSGLSPQEASLLIPLLQDLKGRGLALVLAEHRIKTLFQVADKVLVLHFGRVISQGSPQAVKANHLVKEAYLGSVAQEDHV
jgi:branched-chain amino acid transport system ATP-binding protein